MALAEAFNLNNQITHISLIPAQLSELIKDVSAIEILRKLKAVLIGGSSAPNSLMEESKNLDLKVYNSYGSTEMSSQITCTVQNDNLKHLKTSGKLLEYRELKISSQNEILVKGKTLFKGYINQNILKDPDTHKQIDEEGWFATNDLGFMDDEGYLHVSGRKDLMFVCKGENIFPEEIEDTLREIKEIEDAIVVPINKPGIGQIPAAFLKTINYVELDKSSIKNKLMEKLEFFKVPEIYLDWPYDLEKKSMKPDRESYKKRAIDLEGSNTDRH